MGPAVLALFIRKVIITTIAVCVDYAFEVLTEQLLGDNPSSFITDSIECHGTA